MAEQVLRLPTGAAAPRAVRLLPDGRPGPRVVAPVAGADVRAVTRTASATRRPVHVAVAVGMTAGLYAVSLAGVASLQAGTDARLAAERAPAAAAVDALRTSHDQLDADLARIADSYDGVAAAYQSIADQIAGHEAALGLLGGQITTIEGSAASLRVPAVSRLPSVSSRASAGSVRPVTHACTTASGKPC